MGVFNAFWRRSEPQGEIGYYKLAKWWNTAFTDEERQRILEIYHPIGGQLLEGTILSSSQSALAFLTALAGWFRKDDERPIGYKILAKGEELVVSSESGLDQHFFYQEKIQMHYRDRNDPAHFAEAERACRSQIAIADSAAKEFLKEFPGPLPEHTGYKQLTIILDNRGEREEAIGIARRAEAEGWAGDWAKRIQRYSKR